MALASGDITPEHTYDEIFLWHPEVALTSRSQLASHVRALRKQVAEDDVKAAEDEAALVHDRALFAIPNTNY